MSATQTSPVEEQQPLVTVAKMELNLEVFSGPFDLLLTLVLNEEIDLLEVDLADVVLTYLDYLEQRGQLELEIATEFLVLISALLELKSRLMLPQAEEEVVDLDAGEAAEELLERLLRLQRYRGAAGALRTTLEAQAGYRYRSASLPRHFQEQRLEGAAAVYDPQRLGRALGSLLTVPPKISLRHLRAPRVTVTQRLQVLRDLLRRGSFNFDQAVAGADRMTVAVTIFALLELYKQGQADWRQAEPFAEITVDSRAKVIDLGAVRARRAQQEAVLSTVGESTTKPGEGLRAPSEL